MAHICKSFCLPALKDMTGMEPRKRRMCGAGALLKSHHMKRPLPCCHFRKVKSPVAQAANPAPAMVVHGLGRRGIPVLPKVISDGSAVGNICSSWQISDDAADLWSSGLSTKSAGTRSVAAACPGITKSEMARLSSVKLSASLFWNTW